jgi:hypothetical protein
MKSKKTKIIFYLPLLFLIFSLFYFPTIAQAACNYSVIQGDKHCSNYGQISCSFDNCPGNPQKPVMCTSASNCECCCDTSTTCTAAPTTTPKATGLNTTMPKLQIPIPNLTFSPSTCKTNDKGENVCSVNWIGEYVAGIYQYAIGIVGILAAVVLMIGGVMWIVAGGSATMIGEAKSWVGASLTGLVIALCSYLILYQINPALTVFNPLQITQVKKIETAISGACTWIPDTIGTEGGVGDTICGGDTNKIISTETSKCGTQTTADSGNVVYHCCCSKIATGTGNCVEANFNGTCMAADAATASCVCQRESQGRSIPSTTDLCADGSAFSMGMWQINMIDSHGGANECGGAGGTGGIAVAGNTPASNPYASGRTCLNSNSSIGCCLEYWPGTTICKARNCYKKDSSLYATCSNYLLTPANNIKLACNLYTARRWDPWTTSYNKCK